MLTITLKGLCQKPHLSPIHIVLGYLSQSCKTVRLLLYPDKGTLPACDHCGLTVAPQQSYISCLSCGCVIHVCRTTPLRQCKFLSVEYA